MTPTENDLRTTLRSVVAERDLLREAFVEYAEHGSWRCTYRTRYPWDPDCRCGLTQTCRELGLPIPDVFDPEAPHDER